MDGCFTLSPDGIYLLRHVDVPLLIKCMVLPSIQENKKVSHFSLFN
jgi:hypothetical protein